MKQNHELEANDVMSKIEQEVRSYPTDLSDSEWSILAPLVDTPRIGAGRPRTVDLRAVMNGLRYWLRTGCQWAMIPHDFPPSGTVRYYYDKWTKTGLWEQINTVLRESVRVQLGREAQPSAGVSDSQSVKTTEAGGASTICYRVLEWWDVN
jgi:putative transposase